MKTLKKGSKLDLNGEEQVPKNVEVSEDMMKKLVSRMYTKVRVLEPKVDTLDSRLKDLAQWKQRPLQSMPEFYNHLSTVVIQLKILDCLKFQESLQFLKVLRRLMAY